jgi:hypothetical protein
LTIKFLIEVEPLSDLADAASALYYTLKEGAEY